MKGDTRKGEEHDPGLKKCRDIRRGVDPRGVSDGDLNEPGWSHRDQRGLLISPRG
jgi:hypothetical protein